MPSRLPRRVPLLLLASAIGTLAAASPACATKKAVRDAGTGLLPEGDVPPWLLADLGFYALEPPAVPPAEIQRFTYRNRTAYSFVPQDPYAEDVVYETWFFDTDGIKLGAAGRRVDTLPPDWGAAVPGEVIWRNEPRSRTTAAAAAAVLGEARLASFPALMAYARLELDTGAAWAVTVDGTGWGPPRHCAKRVERKGADEPGVANAAANADVAMAFLVKYRALLSVDDPVSELRVSPWPGQAGNGEGPTVFVQSLEGEEVLGTWVKVWLDRAGHVRLVESEYSPEVRDGHFSVSFAGAKALVAGQAALQHPGVRGSDVGEPLAMWFDQRLPPRLVYRVDVRDPVRATPRHPSWRYEVDAVTGAVTGEYE